MVQALYRLPSASLRALAASLREGLLSAGISHYAVQQVSGRHTSDVEACLVALTDEGMQPKHIAVLAESIAGARDDSETPSDLFDLVLSGPDVPGIPTADTRAVVHTLIEEAQSEVLLVGYVIHEGQKIFERLAAKMEPPQNIRVVFCLDIPRKYTDTSLSSEIVRRFVGEFRAKHWPWPALPQLFYDPRSLEQSTERRSSLHAKCVVVDRRVALVTSANFTEAAQLRNIEAGVLVRYQPLVERLAGYFEGLQASGVVIRCPLE